MLWLVNPTDLTNTRGLVCVACEYCITVFVSVLAVTVTADISPTGRNANLVPLLFRNNHNCTLPLMFVYICMYVHAQKRTQNIYTNQRNFWIIYCSIFKSKSGLIFLVLNNINNTIFKYFKNFIF